MRRSNYRVSSTDDICIVLMDLGPHDKYLTITNDAENVVADLKDTLCGRHLLYLDTDGELTELLHDGEGNFTGFKVHPRGKQWATK